MVGQSDEALKVRVVAVLLRKLDDMTLRRRHERETAFSSAPASRVVLPAHARARRVSLSTYGTMRLHAPSGRATVVSFLVFLASKELVASISDSDEELHQFKDIVEGILEGSRE